MLASSKPANIIAARRDPVLAVKLTERAHGGAESDVEAVFASGWNETAYYHLVAVVALFNLMNRLVEGLGIKLNPVYAQTAAQRLADRGYRIDRSSMVRVGVSY